MKTILFLLNRYPAFGGIETVTTVLANQLAGTYRVIICSSHGEEEHEHLRRLNSSITFYKLQQEEKKEKLAAFDALLRHESVDLVIYQDSYAADDDLALHVARETGIKLIVAEHNSPNHSKISWQNGLAKLHWWDLYHLLKHLYFSGRSCIRDTRRRTRLYTACDRYVLLSEHFKQDFLNNSRTRGTDKLCAIGNPVSYEPSPVNRDLKTKQLLFIGQFVGIKGIDSLLRIWERVQHHAPDWKLTLVGDGPLMADIRAQIEALHLERVELVGYSNRTKDFCASASVFCLTSRFEGFPMVLAEAMSCGAVPVVFNSFSALADIITDGLDGYSIPPYDEEAFAARLLQLIRDDHLRRRMSCAAQEKSEEFNIQAIAARWKTLLDEVLCSPRS